MNPTYDFHERVALITGAGSGMGLATARAFAESGAAVVLSDREEPALQTATDELTSAGHRALAVAAAGTLLVLVAFTVPLTTLTGTAAGSDVGTLRTTEKE